MYLSYKAVTGDKNDCINVHFVQHLQLICRFRVSWKHSLPTDGIAQQVKRHATGRTVQGSIPDGYKGLFLRRKLPRPADLALIQPPPLGTGLFAEISGRNVVLPPSPASAQVSIKCRYTCNPRLCLHGRSYGEIYIWLPTRVNSSVANKLIITYQYAVQLLQFSPQVCALIFTFTFYLLSSSHGLSHYSWTAPISICLEDLTVLIEGVCLLRSSIACSTAVPNLSYDITVELQCPISVSL